MRVLCMRVIGQRQARRGARVGECECECEWEGGRVRECASVRRMECGVSEVQTRRVERVRVSEWVVEWKERKRCKVQKECATGL